MFKVQDDVLLSAKPSRYSNPATLLNSAYNEFSGLPDTATAGVVTSGTVAAGVARTMVVSMGVAAVAAGVSLCSRSIRGVLTGVAATSVAAGVSCMTTQLAVMDAVDAAARCCLQYVRQVQMCNA